MENQDTYNIYKLYKEEYDEQISRDPFRPNRRTPEERRLDRREENLEPEDRYPGKSGKKVDFRDFGPEINDFIENLSEDEKYALVEGYFKYAYRDDVEDLDTVLFNKLQELDKYGKLDLEVLQQGLREYSEDAEDVGGKSRGFSIGNELFDLYSNLDRDARTRSGASVSEELKMIIDELDEIVSHAEQFGSKFDLIKQLRLD